MTSGPLEARSPLDGAELSLSHCRLSEAAPGTILSLAVANGRERAFAAALKKAHGMKLPQPGRMEEGAGGSRLAWLQPGLYFLFSDASGPWPKRDAVEMLDGNGYVTDQTDSWAAIRIEGDGAIAALERVCQLDLDGKAFPPGAAARTVMEHIGTLILRETHNRFLLLAPRSFAGSFWHMLEVSARNTQPA